MIPVYVINLDQYRHRWELISKNLDQIGCKAARIPAIDKAQLCDHPATRRLGVGHVACLKSHGKAMAAFLDTDAPAALILEDDAEVGSAVPEIIRNIDWWPEGHGLVKLDCTDFHGKRIWIGHPVGRTPDGRALHPIVRRHIGAYGYLIDRFTAEEVLKTWADGFVPIDTLLFHLIDSPLARRARPVQAVPGVIRHRPLEQVGSHTGTSRVAGQQRWKPPKLVRWGRHVPVLWAAATGQAWRASVPYQG